MRENAYRDLVLEAFVHATESEEKVARAIALLAPGAPIERSPLSGHFGQPLTLLRAQVQDRASIDRCLDAVRDAVGVQLAANAARRIGPDLVLHVRLDKQEAAAGRIALEGPAAHDIVKLSVRLRAPRLDLEGAVALVAREFGAPAARQRGDPSPDSHAQEP